MFLPGIFCCVVLAGVSFINGAASRNDPPPDVKLSDEKLVGPGVSSLAQLMSPVPVSPREENRLVVSGVVDHSPVAGPVPANQQFLQKSPAALPADGKRAISGTSDSSHAAGSTPHEQQPLPQALGSASFQNHFRDVPQSDTRPKAAYLNAARLERVNVLESAQTAESEGIQHQQQSLTPDVRTAAGDARRKRPSPDHRQDKNQGTERKSGVLPLPEALPLTQRQFPEGLEDGDVIHAPALAAGRGDYSQPSRHFLYPGNQDPQTAPTRPDSGKGGFHSFLEIRPKTIPLPPGSFLSTHFYSDLKGQEDKEETSSVNEGGPPVSEYSLSSKKGQTDNDGVVYGTPEGLSHPSTATRPQQDTVRDLTAAAGKLVVPEGQSPGPDRRRYNTQNDYFPDHGDYREHDPPSGDYKDRTESRQREFSTDHNPVKYHQVRFATNQYAKPAQIRLHSVPRQLYSVPSEFGQNYIQTAQREIPAHYRRYASSKNQNGSPVENDEYGLSSDRYTEPDQYADSNGYPSEQYENEIADARNEQATTNAFSVHRNNMERAALQIPQGFSNPLQSHSSSVEPYVSETKNDRGQSAYDAVSKPRGENSYGSYSFPYSKSVDQENSSYPVPYKQSLPYRGHFQHDEEANPESSRNQRKAFPLMREHIYRELQQGIPPIKGYYGGRRPQGVYRTNQYDSGHYSESNTADETGFSGRKAFGDDNKLAFRRDSIVYLDYRRKSDYGANSYGSQQRHQYPKPPADDYAKSYEHTAVNNDRYRDDISGGNQAPLYPYQQDAPSPHGLNTPSLAGRPPPSYFQPPSPTQSFYPQRNSAYGFTEFHKYPSVSPNSHNYPAVGRQISSSSNPPHPPVSFSGSDKQFYVNQQENKLHRYYLPETYNNEGEYTTQSSPSYGNRDIRPSYERDLSGPVRETQSRPPPTLTGKRVTQGEAFYIPFTQDYSSVATALRGDTYQQLLSSVPGNILLNNRGQPNRFEKTMPSFQDIPSTKGEIQGNRDSQYNFDDASQQEQDIRSQVNTNEMTNTENRYGYNSYRQNQYASISGDANQWYPPPNNGYQPAYRPDSFMTSRSPDQGSYDDNAYFSDPFQTRNIPLQQGGRGSESHSTYGRNASGDGERRVPYKPNDRTVYGTDSAIPPSSSKSHANGLAKVNRPLFLDAKYQTRQTDGNYGSAPDTGNALRHGEGYEHFPESRPFNIGSSQTFGGSTGNIDLQPSDVSPFPNAYPSVVRSNQEVGVAVVRGPSTLQDPVLRQVSLLQRRLEQAQYENYRPVLLAPSFRDNDQNLPNHGQDDTL